MKSSGNLPYDSHVKKHDTRLLIGRIAFLTRGKSDTLHLIGLHQFANENLLCGFSVCKSQYVYNKSQYSQKIRQIPQKIYNRQIHFFVWWSRLRQNVMQGKSRNFPNAEVRLHQKLTMYQLYQSKIIRWFIYFFDRERAVSWESCNLIGSVSGQYFPISWPRSR